MELPRILDYKNEKLEEKISFSKKEKGSFGIFYEDWNGFSSNLFNQDNLIIFAPGQEIFDNQKYNEKTPNQRFLLFLKENIFSLREHQEKLNGNRCYFGRKEGKYEFKNDMLIIKPEWKTEKLILNSEEMADILRIHKRFQLKNYSIERKRH